MMTVAEMEAHVNGLEYMPGWSMTIVSGELAQEGTQLRIRARVPNSYKPTEMVDLDIWTYVPPMPSPATFDWWLSWRLARIACHESSEWLRRDGKPIFDPHEERA